MSLFSIVTISNIVNEGKELAEQKYQKCEHVPLRKIGTMRPQKIEITNLEPFERASPSVQSSKNSSSLSDELRMTILQGASPKL